MRHANNSIAKREAYDKYKMPISSRQEIIVPCSESGHGFVSKFDAAQWNHLLSEEQFKKTMFEVDWTHRGQQDMLSGIRRDQERRSRGLHQRNSQLHELRHRYRVHRVQYGQLRLVCRRFPRRKIDPVHSVRNYPAHRCCLRHHVLSYCIRLEV